MSTVCELRSARCLSWIQKKQRNQKSNCQHWLDHRKCKRIKKKKWSAASLTMLKSLTVWITTDCRKFLNRWEYQTILPASWEIRMQIKNKQLELDMEQWTVSKLGKEYIKAVHCHLAYLTYMQSTHLNSQGGWSTRWKQDCQKKY